MTTGWRDGWRRYMADALVVVLTAAALLVAQRLWADHMLLHRLVQIEMQRQQAGQQAGQQRQQPAPIPAPTPAPVK